MLLFHYSNVSRAHPLWPFILCAVWVSYVIVCATRSAQPDMFRLSVPGILFTSDGGQISLGRLSMVKNNSLSGETDLSPLLVFSSFPLLIHTYLPLQNVVQYQFKIDRNTVAAFSSVGRAPAACVEALQSLLQATPVQILYWAVLSCVLLSPLCFLSLSTDLYIKGGKKAQKIEILQWSSCTSQLY